MPGFLPRRGNRRSLASASGRLLELQPVRADLSGERPRNGPAGGCLGLSACGSAGTPSRKRSRPLPGVCGFHAVEFLEICFDFLTRADDDPLGSRDRLAVTDDLGAEHVVIRLAAAQVWRGEDATAG